MKRSCSLAKLDFSTHQFKNVAVVTRYILIKDTTLWQHNHGRNLKSYMLGAMLTYAIFLKIAKKMHWSV